jgi:hypothetical protein
MPGSKDFLITVNPDSNLWSADFILAYLYSMGPHIKYRGCLLDSPTSVQARFGFSLLVCNLAKITA